MKIHLCLLILVVFLSCTYTSCTGNQRYDVTTDSTTENLQNQTITKITFERTRCFGDCPVYKVTILNDGTVNYAGEMYVAVTGTQLAKIEATEFNRLVEYAHRISFFDLNSEYRVRENPDGTASTVTDQPSRITTIYRGETAKRVLNYFGGPDELAEFEDLIYQVSGVKEWVE